MEWNKTEKYKKLDWTSAQNKFNEILQQDKKIIPVTKVNQGNNLDTYGIEVWFNFRAQIRIILLFCDTYINYDLDIFTV